jgi:hypothetical protein
MPAHLCPEGPYTAREEHPWGTLCGRQPLGELTGDLEKSKRVTDTVLNMQKIIVADLQKAYDNKFGQFPS